MAMVRLEAGIYDLKYSVRSPGLESNPDGPSSSYFAPSLATTLRQFTYHAHGLSDAHRRMKKEA